MSDETLIDNLSGYLLNEYKLEALLGQGGMACVYRGLDVRLKRPAAIKVIDTPFRDNKEYTARFEREAQAIGQLNHPHIVSVYRYGEAHGVLYIAMEYIEGADFECILASYEDEGETIQSEEAGRIIREVCSALDYAHSRGVIHRDIKPSNILLDKQGHTHLSDFGLALLDDHQTRGEILGTPHYISPEQAISSANAVPQSDLYAIGVILYEMFTKKLPFEASHPYDVALKHVDEEPLSPRSINPNISPALEAVILKALAKPVEERYPTGAALADALDQALGLAPRTASPLGGAKALKMSQALAAVSPSDSLPETFDMSHDRAGEQAGGQEQIIPGSDFAVAAPTGQAQFPSLPPMPPKAGRLISPHYNLKNIRQLLTELTEQISEEELRQLCFDVPDFKPVYHQLTQTKGKAEIIDRLLEYAEQTMRVEELLNLAKAHNRTIYEKHKPYQTLKQTSRVKLVGSSLGKYHIVELLGQGGMADVYKAYQPGLARYVAIKLIHSHLTRQVETIERFEREAMAVANLRHPNIVQVFDFDREDDHHYMVMEFVPGPTLAAELLARRAREQRFSLPEIVNILNDLTGAIDYAHAQGVIHRDLKPGNIMFTPEKRVVLTDFGIARIANIPSYTTTNAVVGTPAYMSPEQALSERVDERSDVYSLGVILYELATGRIPFEGDNPMAIMMQMINGSWSRPTAVNPKLPAAVEQVILKAMDKDPEARYQSAQALALALQNTLPQADARPDASRQPSMLVSQRPEDAARAEAGRPGDNQALQQAQIPEIHIPDQPPRQPDGPSEGRPEKPGSVINISGNTGQIALGGGRTVQFGNITGGQISVGSGSGFPLAEETSQADIIESGLAAIRQKLAHLKQRVEAETPADKQSAAMERLLELEEAMTTAPPDLDTSAYVQRWFVKQGLGLAEAVTSLITGPDFSRLIEATDPSLAAEFRRRLG